MPDEIEIKVQKIKDDGFLENINLEPKSVREFGVTNMFTRTFAHLFGAFGTLAKRLQCTSAGVLLVAPQGSGFNFNDTKTGNAPNAYAAIQTFDAQASRIDVYAFDNACLIKRSLDGVTFHDAIELPANSMMSFDATTVGFTIQNKVALSVCRYQIVGWY